MKKMQVGALILVLLFALTMRLGCYERSPGLKVPFFASYSTNEYGESGFMAMDGHMLKVFTLSPKDLLSWKSNVEAYTASHWRPCPAGDLVEDSFRYYAPEMFSPNGGEYIAMYEQSDHAELFYISPSGQCVWFAQW